MALMLRLPVLSCVFPTYRDAFLTAARPSEPRNEPSFIISIEASHSIQVSPIIAITSFIAKASSSASFLYLVIASLISFGLEKQLLSLSLAFMTLTLSKVTDVVECPSGKVSS